MFSTDNQFLDSAVELTKGADKDPVSQSVLYKNFVREFGTHYSKSTWMGVKVYAETRYSSRESSQLEQVCLLSL